MKLNIRRLIGILISFALIIGAQNVFASGSDYPNDRPVSGSTNWPKGLDTLINVTNRVHGFWVNQVDTFFFSGNASQLTAFLRDYSQLEGVESHRLILHDGAGEAKSPWEKTGRPCDWELYVVPKGWYNIGVLIKQGTNSVEALRKAGQEPGYIVEVHFWTGGHIAFDQIDVPKNVEVKKEK